MEKIREMKLKVPSEEDIKFIERHAIRLFNEKCDTTYKLINIYKKMLLKIEQDRLNNQMNKMLFRNNKIKIDKNTLLRYYLNNNDWESYKYKRYKIENV